MSRPDELKLVELGSTIQATWLERKATTRAQLPGVIGAVSVLPMLLGAVAASSSFGTEAGVLAGLATLGVLALSLTQMVVLYRRLKLDGNGVTLEMLPLRRATSPPQLSVAELRDAQSSRYLLRDAGPPQRLSFVDIADMGHTDFSVWFERDGGERYELMLEQFPRAEVQRLHDTIRPHWQRARDAASDADEARQQRQRLARLQQTGRQQQ